MVSLLLIYLAVLDLCHCAWAFSSVEWGLLSSCSVSASHCDGFFCCEAWALGTQAQQLQLTGSRAPTQSLGCLGLITPQHVASSWTRDQICVPCIGKWILIQCTTREVPVCLFVYFWLHLVFLAAGGLSLGMASGGYSSLWCTGFSCGGFSCGGQASPCGGFCCCGAQALGT